MNLFAYILYALLIILTGLAGIASAGYWYTQSGRSNWHHAAAALWMSGAIVTTILALKAANVWILHFNQ